MEPFTAFLTVIELLGAIIKGFKAAKEASGAAKDSIKTLQSDIDRVEKALELVSGVQLTPRGKDIIAEWKVECLEILRELRKQADGAFEMCSSIGLRETIVARYR